MKKLQTLLALLLVCSIGIAQDDREYESYKKQATEEFDNYKTDAELEYAKYREKANADYAAFVEQTWVEMHAMAGIKPPTLPKPRHPQRQQTTAPERFPIRIPYDSIVPMPLMLEEIEIPPIPYIAVSNEEQEEVDFFATKVVVRVAKKLSLLRLASLAEKEVAKAWRMMARGSYDGLLSDCLRQYKSLRLCDWSYIQFCGAAAERLFGKRSNEAVLLQAFLLTQSGYRVRLARAGNKLVLLAPFNHTVYNYSYLNIDGERYYVLDKIKAQSYRVCKAFFPKERTANISLTHQPLLAARNSVSRIFQGGRYPDMKVSVSINKNLIDFFKNYPITNAWDSYTKASFSETTKKALYPTLRQQLKGKNEHTAADMLLDFVQHAFKYKTDQEQFGYERPLFGDESFFYPYNDCEDRSIVFSILVRELLGLDVVLLHYPGHLATAIHFNDNVSGDYVMVNDKIYTVCDPTYIGASVGESMPLPEGGKVKVIVL